MITLHKNLLLYLKTLTLHQLEQKKKIHINKHKETSTPETEVGRIKHNTIYKQGLNNNTCILSCKISSFFFFFFFFLGGGAYISTTAEEILSRVIK
jgi:hypothetical protein